MSVEDRCKDKGVKGRSWSYKLVLWIVVLGQGYKDMC